MTPAAHTAFRYMTRFRCLGSSCEDSCCSGGWEIQVDQPHFKKIRDAMERDPATRREFDGAFRRVKDPTRSRGKFALVVLDERGGCKLLTGDGLCSIHARWGEAALPDTCAIYPRAIARSGARLELAGSVSCPEVARQVLLHDDALDLEVASPDAFVRPLYVNELDDHPSRPYDRYHDELKNLVKDLLGDARFPLVSRLAFVSYFAHRVGAFLDESSRELDEARLAAEIERILDPALREELDRRFRAMGTDASLPTKVVMTLLHARTSSSGPQGFRRLVETVLARYVGEGEHDASAVMQAYAVAKSKSIADAAVVDRLLANYARHYWVREWFHHSPSLLAHQMQLLMRLAVLRFVISGHPLLKDGLGAEERREVTERAVVDAVQKFSRVFEHDAAFSKLLQRELAAASMVTLAHAACIGAF